MFPEDKVQIRVICQPGKIVLMQNVPEVSGANETSFDTRFSKRNVCKDD
ncbi:MAG: hypothetical protein JWQ96_292 [Segetibacter sp.]|nr:hypothetical protein [Segetibacter sp.]